VSQSRVAGGPTTAATAGWRVLFTVAPIVMAFACAFMTGVVFGYLPAREAAQLDPIEALARDWTTWRLSGAAG
jgi:macrolide transport system ATP-binding/permease protein